MKLGFLTAPFPETPLMEVADWAAEVGFEVLEIACWPRSSGATRKYAGTSHIDVDDLSDARASEIKAEIAAKGLDISGLGYYPNPLHPDPAKRAAAIDHLKKVIVATAKMGLPVTNTFCGGDASKHVDANWEEALAVWPDIVRFAQDHGVKITFENCPMIFSYDEWPAGHNIAYSPYIWRRILEQWGGTVGLNFDPSHLVWLMIDQGRFIREFGAHILHFQAKDVQIDRDGPVHARLHLGRHRLAGPAHPRARRRPLGRDLLGALSQRLRWTHHHRARGQGLRGHRREGQARLPRGARRAAPIRQVVTTSRTGSVTDINGSVAWFREAEALLERIITSQAEALEAVAQVCADSIAADGLVHLFGTGHSRIPVEEMFPRYGSFPGFHPIVELSMTYHTDVVGSNGQRQAMFIERVPGLAEVILDNFSFGTHDVMMVFSANGLTAVPVEMARGARRRGLKVIAVTGVQQSLAGEPDPAVGGRLLDEADLVIDLCTPEADAMVLVPGLDTPVGPGSTLAYVAIVNSLKVRIAQLLTERGIRPPVITRASVVGAERSRALFDSAYREHARRVARTIVREPDDEPGSPAR